MLHWCAEKNEVSYHNESQVNIILLCWYINYFLPQTIVSRIKNESNLIKPSIWSAVAAMQCWCEWTISLLPQVQHKEFKWESSVHTIVLSQHLSLSDPIRVWRGNFYTKTKFTSICVWTKISKFHSVCVALIK